jgi:WD40 repeat protein
MVRIWNAESGENLRTLQGGGDSRARIAFSPDGRRIASAGNERRTVSIWGVKSGQLEATLSGHAGLVTAVAFDPSGGALASAGSIYKGALNEVIVWDLSRGKASLNVRGHSGDINDLKFSPDGSELISAGGEGQIKRWNARTGEELETIRAHQSSVTSVAYGPDGRHFASAGGRMNVSGEVKLWDREGNRERRRVAGYAAAFGRHGARLATAKRGEVEVRDLSSLTTVSVLKVRDAADRDKSLGKSLIDVAFTPAGSWIAAVDQAGIVTIWETNSVRPIRSLQGQGLPERWANDNVFRPDSRDIAFSPDGKRLALTGWGRISLWEVPGFRKVWERASAGGDSARLAFSPDGRRVATNSHPPGALMILDADTGREALTIRAGFKGGIFGIAFSGNGRLIAIGGYDGALTLYNADNGREVRTFKGNTGAVYDLTFSPDCRRLASAGEVIKLWDLGTGKELINLKEVAHRVEFSPDGNHLVSSSYDGVKLRSIH